MKKKIGIFAIMLLFVALLTPVQASLKFDYGCSDWKRTPGTNPPEECRWCAGCIPTCWFPPVKECRTVIPE